MLNKNKKISASAFKRITAIFCTMLMIVTLLCGCMPAADTAGGENTPGGSYLLIIYLVIIVVVFYFFMIRPEKKKRKKAEDMRNSLSVGDSVTTIGGMVGKIVNVSDEYITFETGEDRVRIKIAKWGISSIGKDAEEPTDKPVGE